MQDLLLPDRYKQNFGRFEQKPFEAMADFWGNSGAGGGCFLASPTRKTQK